MRATRLFDPPTETSKAAFFQLIEERLAADLLRKSEFYNFDFLHDKPMEVEEKASQQSYSWTPLKVKPIKSQLSQKCLLQPKRSDNCLKVSSTQIKQSQKGAPSMRSSTCSFHSLSTMADRLSSIGISHEHFEMDEEFVKKPQK